MWPLFFLWLRGLIFWKGDGIFVFGVWTLKRASPVRPKEDFIGSLSLWGVGLWCLGKRCLVTRTLWIGLQEKCVRYGPFLLHPLPEGRGKLGSPSLRVSVCKVCVDFSNQPPDKENSFSCFSFTIGGLWGQLLLGDYVALVQPKKKGCIWLFWIHYLFYESDNLGCLSEGCDVDNRKCSRVWSAGQRLALGFHHFSSIFIRFCLGWFF